VVDPEEAKPPPPAVLRRFFFLSYSAVDVDVVAVETHVFWGCGGRRKAEDEDEGPKIPRTTSMRTAENMVANYSGNGAPPPREQEMLGKVGLKVQEIEEGRSPAVV